MPTESLKTIKPSGQGGDYTSLAAWEAGEQADLVTADLYAVAEIQGDWSGGPDTSAVVISGWTTDATHYVEIRADAANSATADWDATKYILENTTSPIVVGVDFLRVVRVQFSLGSSTASRKVFDVSSVGSPTATYVDGCLFRGHGYSGAYSIGLYIFDATANVYATNCVSFNHGTNSTSAAYRLNSQNQTVLYNCTAYGSYYGFRQSSGTVIAKNCISQNATVDFSGTFDAASDYNCDEDGTAPGANSVTGTVTFVAVGSDDYHLASGDTVAKDAGTDLSADSTYAFSTDIDGDTRTGSWDIGADEYASGGGGSFSDSHSDSLTLGEVISPVANFNPSVSESVTLNETQSVSSSFARSQSESFSISEAISPSASFVSVIAEALGISDSQLASALFSRLQTESLSFAEALDYALSLAASASDSFALSESVSSESVFSRSIAEGITISEALAQATDFALQLTESLTLSDTPSEVADYVRSIVEGFSIADTVDAARALYRSVADSFGLADSFLSDLYFGASISDILSFSDNATVEAIYAAQLVEAIALTESVGTASDYARQLQDNIALADLLGFSQAFARSVTESLALTDSVNSSANFVSSAAETLVLSESITPLYTFISSVADSLTFGDTASGTTEITVAKLPPINLASLSYAVSSLGLGEADSNLV